MKILIKRDMLTRYIANTMIYLVNDIDHNLITLVSIRSNPMFDGDIHDIELIYTNPNRPMEPLIYNELVRTDKKTHLCNTFITIPYTDYIIVNRVKLIKLCIKTLEGLLKGMDNNEYYLELIEGFNIRHHIRERRRRHY